MPFKVFDDNVELNAQVKAYEKFQKKLSQAENEKRLKYLIKILMFQFENNLIDSDSAIEQKNNIIKELTDPKIRQKLEIINEFENSDIKKVIEHDAFYIHQLCYALSHEGLKEKNLFGMDSSESTIKVLNQALDICQKLQAYYAGNGRLRTIPLLMNQTIFIYEKISMAYIDQITTASAEQKLNYINKAVESNKLAIDLILSIGNDFSFSKYALAYSESFLGYIKKLSLLCELDTTNTVKHAQTALDFILFQHFPINKSNINDLFGWIKTSHPEYVQELNAAISAFQKIVENNQQVVANAQENKEPITTPLPQSVAKPAQTSTLQIKRKLTLQPEKSTEKKAKTDDAKTIPDIKIKNVDRLTSIELDIKQNIKPITPKQHKYPLKDKYAPKIPPAFLQKKPPIQPRIILPPSGIFSDPKDLFLFYMDRVESLQVGYSSTSEIYRNIFSESIPVLKQHINGLDIYALKQTVDEADDFSFKIFQNIFETIFNKISSKTEKCDIILLLAQHFMKTFDERIASVFKSLANKLQGGQEKESSADIEQVQSRAVFSSVK